MWPAKFSLITDIMTIGAFMVTKGEDKWKAI